MGDSTGATGLCGGATQLCSKNRPEEADVLSMRYEGQYRPNCLFRRLGFGFRQGLRFRVFGFGVCGSGLG